MIPPNPSADDFALATLAATPTAKPGRPPAGGPTPVRHIRISDAEWAEMRLAAAVAGDTLSSFVRQVTLRAARRLNGRTET